MQHKTRRKYQFLKKNSLLKCVHVCVCACVHVRGEGGGGCIEYNLFGKTKTKAAVKMKIPPSPVCVLLPQCAMPAYHAADTSPNNVSAYLGICQLCK